MSNKFQIKDIKAGSRGSPLALVQVDELYSLLRAKGIHVNFDRVVYKTQGDKDKKTSLTENLADDFFTDALDEALLKGEIDIAVHSAKDLPAKMREGLSVIALTASLDETDAFLGKMWFEELKVGAKVGTSSAIRQRGVRELRPDVDVVDIRGTIEERMQLVEKGVCDGIIVATVALKRLGLQQHIKDVMPWEASPLQGQLAVVGRTDDIVFNALFSSIDVRKTYGCVHLVGAGPGDPDLITMKGVKALGQADCVFYDYLANKDLLEYAQKAQKVYVGKRKGAHALPQVDLERQLRQKAIEGKNVVRLKGGDPFIFGRGAEEIEYLRAYHIDVKVIPGVSSATGVPSSLGVPLTARDISSSVAFISGYAKNEKSSTLQPVEIPDVDTIVFLMGITKLDGILESLAKAGWKAETPILIVSKGTCEDEKIIAGNLKTIIGKVEEQKPEQPILIIVGQTVKFWNPQAYTQSRILYTGTNPEKLRPFGNVIHLPMIQITQVQLAPQEVCALIDSLAKYHMILLTSRFSVKYFFEILKARNYDLEGLKEKDFLVIGKSTAEALREYDFEPALVAHVETSEGLLKAITGQFDVGDKKILFPRSSLSNPYLKDELTKRGAEVEQLVVYQNTKPLKRDLPKEGIDKILFTSPSTVRNFLQDYDEIPDGWKILSKGVVTSQTLKDTGYESEVLIDG